MPNPPRKRGPPASLRIDTPAHNPTVALALGDSSASALSSATSDSDFSPFASSTKPKPLRNMKKLSLTLPSAQSSSNSLQLTSEPQSATSVAAPELLRPERPRRPSVISLPATANPTANSLIHRKEDGEDAVPYADGPLQIIPGVWLGSEDNARDWKGLIERGIKSVLNVAKEVASPLDSGHAQPLRAVSSTPNFKKSSDPESTYHPPNLVTGRPGMHYLKLQWSHGQQDLVDVGFLDAMAFTDAALERGEGVLVHCQCGISRSATLVIALVMRAAAQQSPSVPPEVWALKGMQGAYSFVKEKSKWVGPNMSLIYQLLEYEKKLKGDTGSPSGSSRSSCADEEEEWGRRRKLLDEAPSDGEEERENTFVMREAEALDKAMEERVVARKSSASSVASSSNSGVGMGAAWRTRYGNPRKRTGSIASNMTNGSMLSEDLVEEEEEEELLGVGGGFDSRSLSAEPEDSSATNSPEDEIDAPSPRVALFTPTTARPPATARPTAKAPPSAPVWKTSFNIAPLPATATRSTFNIYPPRASAVRSTFNLPPRPPPRGKRRPAPIGILPPVPSSPIAIVIGQTPPSDTPVEPSKPTKSVPSRTSSTLSLPPVRVRTESKKLPPPLHLRNSLLKKTNPLPEAPAVSTPSQTLFVFPPSPTLTTRTPSTMTLTSSVAGLVPFPSLSTPRISTFRSQGRTRSFIGLGAPPTPTTAFSKVDARGYVGLE
ncbi:putative dual specificity phosphatase, catalytic domain [Lyophyllum shimeji]|uniref:protein-tyrosine-phosphatase n=1 Tax=Lyophyllum shimeji TaxID=47721 RepID=A0A9P3PJ35_LYOSH|nr:putative dual specificity phosphatase, catalytic domain [Lyophyllum shimeji]